MTARTVLIPLVLLAAACSPDDPSSGTAAPATTAQFTTTTTVQQGPAGLTEGSLVTPDGTTRTYRVYVPRALPPGPAPLVIALHGGTGSGAQFRRTSGLDEFADAMGFIAVYPDGTGQLRTWNAGYCCGAAQRNQVDDVGFIRLLLDTIEGGYSIDPNRVFAMGHSNGGMLSYRLACELADRIAAVALQAGSLGVDDCAPARPVSLLHIQGTADTNHPIDGGVGADSISGVSYRSADESLDMVATAMGCADGGSSTEDGDVTRIVWSTCDGGVELQFDVVEGATHAWMGHPAVNPNAHPPYAGLDATAEAVGFLLAHPRPQ